MMTEKETLAEVCEKYGGVYSDVMIGDFFGRHAYKLAETQQENTIAENMSFEQSIVHYDNIYNCAREMLANEATKLHKEARSDGEIGFAETMMEQRRETITHRFSSAQNTILELHRENLRPILEQQRSDEMTRYRATLEAMDDIELRGKIIDALVELHFTKQPTI